MNPKLSSEHFFRKILALILGCMMVPSLLASEEKLSGVEVIQYDSNNPVEFDEMWVANFGPLELAVGATREVSNKGIRVAAVPFKTASDFSVFDHLKYFATSSRTFNVPENGSLEFSANIMAETPGTEQGRKIFGCYGPSFSYPSLETPCDKPFEQTVLEGQQAGVVLNMINFETGQLFDWFVSGSKAFALIERLPSVVTQSPGTPVEKAYTQIIAEVDIAPNRNNNFAIRYTRGPGKSFVEYVINQQLFARVDMVGIPLDVQNVPYTGYAPSLGAGEDLKDKLNSFVIGHGLFSLLDAFPYHHPDAPELSVSIPISERIFGQGAIGSWDKFRVVTKSN